MERCEDSSETVVGRVREMMQKLEGEETDPCLFVSPSAYDTAWLAMVIDPDKETQRRPMFEGCLDWVLKNQRPEGFWGERDCYGYPTLDSLPSTLACMVALKTWGVGHEHIQKGMAFISSTSTKILNGEGEDKHVNYPLWFAIVFPAMVELARDTGLHLIFPDEAQEAVAHVFNQRHHILATEKQVVGNYNHPPMLAYLEALPPMYKIDHATILGHLDDSGSLFRSPSATAAAFSATGNHRTLSYLRRLLPTCTSGVPSIYPIDVDFIRLNMVHEIQSLGLSEHFSEEIKEILEQVYMIYGKQEPSQRVLAPSNVLKDSLAFQLLRLHGYKVSPTRLCWFLKDAMALEYIGENFDKLSSMLYSLHRATNLIFQGETELQELRSFLRTLLLKSCLSTTLNDAITMWPHLQDMIKHEISIPWLARMDHLENRKWIEEHKKRVLWFGKASYYRLSCIDDKDLLQLAKKNYEHRQLVYKKELEELVRWSKAWGLTDMGFAREKTVYCYFAVATSISFPYDSEVRLIVAKAAILITILDDFFDTEGSLDELQILTQAIQRWDNKGLRSHSKILFDALDNTVIELAKKYHDQHGIHIINYLRQMWYETIASWLIEAIWSKSGIIPSIASYLETGMISIAAHVLVLQASCAFTPTISPEDLHPSQYKEITKSLMISCRLLNDIQSYEKEVKDGKINSVMLYLKENPSTNIVKAIDYVQSMLDETMIYMLEHALIDEHLDDLPKSFKKLHLGCLKVFHMFFNSTNHFDTKDSLLSVINKAIFIPLEVDKDDWNFQPRRPRSMPLPTNVVTAPVKNCIRYINLKHHHKWRSPFTIPRVMSLRNYQVGTAIRSTTCNLSFV